MYGSGWQTLRSLRLLPRSTASWRKDFLPSKASSCLGVFSRLTGQKRSPRPPAMMMTKQSFKWVLVLIDRKMLREM